MTKKFKHKKKNKGFSLSWWLLTLFISFAISMGIIFLVHICCHPQLKKISNDITTNMNILKESPMIPKLPIIKHKMNILAIGVDTNGRNTDPFKNTRSDVIIVVSLDPEKKTVNAISIPRDSKVFLAENKGIDKLNAAHAYGGADLTVKTIEQTLGIEIDHYVTVNYAGLKEFVKAVDGVPVFVEKRMKYTDRAGKLYINLQPGEQILNEDQSEMYLRFRHDALGDLGRIKRQQWFLKGVMQKMKEPAMLLKIPELIKIASKNTQTDMDTGTMLKIANFLKDINFNNIQVATVPGYPSMDSNISYLIIDSPKTQLLVDRLIFGYDTLNDNTTNNDPIKISLLYNPERKESFDELTTELEQNNYEIVCKKKSKETHTTILSHSTRATLDIANEIKFSSSKLRKAPVFIHPKENYCASSDFTIMLGIDN